MLFRVVHYLDPDCTGLFQNNPTFITERSHAKVANNTAAIGSLPQTLAGDPFKARQHFHIRRRFERSRTGQLDKGDGQIDEIWRQYRHQ